MEGGEAGGGGEAPPPKDSGPPGEVRTSKPSATSMSKGAPGGSAAGPTKMQACKATCKDICHFVYNRDAGTVMGRGCRRWTFLILFYILFYLTILGFFLAYLGVVMSTIDKKTPTEYWQPDSKRAYWDGSRLQKNPAVIFYPNTDRESNPDSALIWITKGNMEVWAKQVHEQVEGYKLKGGGDELPIFNGQGKDDCVNPDGKYGYTTGQPIFIVRITKMLKWKPEPFASEGALLEYLKKPEFEGSVIATKPDFVKEQYNKDPKKLLIVCEGEKIWDSQALTKITYCGGAALDISKYPYDGTTKYLAPLIAIQFKDAVPGVPITVECFPLAANIEANKKQGQGREKFEFMIDI